MTLIDNDVILKAICYGIMAKILDVHCGPGNECGYLGAAQYVLAKKIRKLRLNQEKTIIENRLAEFLIAATKLETSPDEQRMAAEFEYEAQLLGLNLDSGESQLCAIAISRAVSILLTGDKRAIVAMEQLLDVCPELRAVQGKVKCLERIVASLMEAVPFEDLRAAVCSEPGIDRAITICFACTNPAVTGSDVMEGLSSYINDLLASAPRVVAP